MDDFASITGKDTTEEGIQKRWEEWLAKSVTYARREKNPKVLKLIEDIDADPTPSKGAY